MKGCQKSDDSHAVLSSTNVEHPRQWSSRQFTIHMKYKHTNSSQIST